ncbi:mitochondrial K+-H+ exchange-related-domain-containing protein [Mycena rosella]|uniref:Mitochondrial K+-H+ exchange-related-domain-containing protein n=1 Tax=Mycena rosella TaxID=1033263 RepID=A0AAD7C2U8_MYCRO|nr:mitochondrial K+-H+ exchange-related-domain-containing protein [Mycena rosella]
MAMIPRSGVMRIIALPLTRPAVINIASASSSSKLPTFYSYKITAPTQMHKVIPPRTLFTRWIPEEGLGKWASRKWANFGIADKGTLKSVPAGERLMDRLDFEESNLKTIDISIAPAANEAEVQIPLLYPSAVLSGPQSLDHLRALVEEQIPLHNRGIATWIFVSIIPNFPFYFCAWRTYSHWQAKRAARYIQSLLQNNRIAPQPLMALNAVYDGSKPVVLTRDALERAVRALTMAPGEAKELFRAHEQVVARVAKMETLGNSIQ